VKLCLLTLGAALLSAAQSSTTTYTTDINGRRAGAGPFSSTDGTRTERTQSINGQSVPLEQVEERVLRSDASGKVTERIVRRYDATGRISSTERVLAEEQKLPDGGSTLRETTFRGDINGTMREAERRLSETRVSGSTATTNTSIDRPSINGSFETAEKRTAVANTAGDRTETNETVLRRGETGRFYEARRETKVVTKTGDQTTENTAVYEPSVTGQLELASQARKSSVKRPDGSEATQVDLYSRAADGRVQEAGAKQQIKEQQLIVKQRAPDGSVVETLSVRRPSVADPTRLGNPQQISETVCRGKCDASKP
jgi:hypothetical protein